MRKKLLIIFLFLVLTTSGCGAKAPQDTLAPTQTDPSVATEEKEPAASELSSGQVGATSTAGTPIPTNLPGCTNSAAFVADVTVPDNTSIPSGTTFVKTWRVKNTGTCIWGPDYTLTHYSEEKMWAPPAVPLSLTYPNQTVDLSMELKAPSSSGSHRSFFAIKNPAGLIMKIDNDSRLWVVIDVSSTVTSDSTATQSLGGIDGSGSTNAACPYTTDAAKIMQTINAINSYREENGLPPYTVNEPLTRAATTHANDMACNKLFSHRGSNGSTPTTRVAASGYSAASVTENVYGSYPPLSGQGVVEWWKNDMTDLRHNQNLLSTTYTEIGVGYSFYNNFGYYVLVFARP